MTNLKTQSEKQVEPLLVVGTPCPYMMGNKLMCGRTVLSGTYCPRHNLLQPLFGTTLSNTVDFPNEYVGSQS